MGFSLVYALAVTLSAQDSAERFTMADAVALAVVRNRGVIAAQLDVQDKLVDEMASRLWDNPEISYNIANILLSASNTEYNPGAAGHGFSQRQQNIGLSQTFDIWRKRSQRFAIAKQNTEVSRLAVADVLRELAFQVRSAFAAVVREQAESALVEKTRLGYEQTVQLMRRREAAGDIARTDLDKVELESMRLEQRRYQAAVELADARMTLAALLAFGDATALPKALTTPNMPTADAMAIDEDALLAAALQRRPDLRGAEATRILQLLAHRGAIREALPDLQIGVAYQRSNFLTGGDNENTLQLTAGMPLPIFDRNQGGRRHTQVARLAADNTLVELRLQVQREVRLALQRWCRFGDSLKLYEAGGMLERASRATQVAKKSFAAGATSLLDLLEAERTQLATQADYLQTLDAWRQAHLEVAHATAQDPPTGGL